MVRRIVGTIDPTNCEPLPCVPARSCYTAISLPTHQAVDQLSPSSYGNRLFSGARTTKPLKIQPGSAKKPPLATTPWGLGRRFHLAQAAQNGGTAGKRRILTGRMKTPLFQTDGFVCDYRSWFSAMEIHIVPHFGLQVWGSNGRAGRYPKERQTADKTERRTKRGNRLSVHRDLPPRKDKEDRQEADRNECWWCGSARRAAVATPSFH